MLVSGVLPLGLILSERIGGRNFESYTFNLHDLLFIYCIFES